MTTATRQRRQGCLSTEFQLEHTTTAAWEVRRSFKVSYVSQLVTEEKLGDIELLALGDSGEEDAQNDHRDRQSQKGSSAHWQGAIEAYKGGSWITAPSELRFINLQMLTHDPHNMADVGDLVRIRNCAVSDCCCTCRFNL